MMLLSFGRWGSQSLRLDVAKRTWGISVPRQPQYLFRGIQDSFKHFHGDDSSVWRPRGKDWRPAGVRLAAAILGSNPHSLFGAASDSKLAKESREEIFEALSLRLPEMLPDFFKSSEDYHVKMQQLVVEEAWFTITTALNELQSKKQQQLEKDSVRIHVTGAQSRRNPWFEVYSYKPLSKQQRKTLRTGSVVIMVPAGREFTTSNIILGVLRRGSENSQTCKFLFS